VLKNSFFSTLRCSRRGELEVGADASPQNQYNTFPIQLSIAPNAT
jgi:hypothetical protein